MLLELQKRKLCFLLFLMVVINHSLNAQTSNLWVTISPNSGGVNQVDTDIIVNNGFQIENNSSNNINCIQLTSGNDLIYSITSSGSDVNKDGNNDIISFDLIVKGYTDATYNYNAAVNSSSVTNYGTQAGVTVIDNSWGVLGDYDVDAGESLVYTIENLLINGESSDLNYELNYTNANFIEPNGGRDHTLIFGLGDSLESLEIDSNKSITLSSEDSFSVTGAGSFFANDREWSITSLTFNIKISGSEIVSDLTDYSWFEKGTTYYHDYPAQTKQKSTLPSFSWNKIPRWVAARNVQAFSDEQIEDIADNFQLILLEKANNQGFDYIEDGIENAATRIKALNPNLTTLFYYNTYINYGGYEANIEYEENVADWSTYEDGAIYLFKDLYYWYDQDIEGMREWWIDTCVKMAELDVIDGVFIDKVVNPDENGDVLNADGSPVNNYTKMLKDLNDQLPDDKLLVGNTLRNERAGGSRGLMEIMDGSYIERWDFPSTGQSDAEAITVSIQLMREALQKGKMINFQTSPDSATEEEKPTDATELLAYTKEHVYFPLAVYLMIAEENAYFSYATGVNAISSSSVLWNTSFIEEFDNFLGEPLGDPVKEGYLYRRSFENLDVWVNVETKETGFTWKGKTATETSRTTCIEGTNLSLNGTISDFSAEQNTTNTVSNILNEEDTNRWSVLGFPQHVTIDLGAIQNINEVRLIPYLNRDYQFIVEGSTTTATSGFSTILDATDNTTSGSLITKSFDTASVRYVKLTITGAATYTGSWASLHSFQVNCAGTEEIVPEVIHIEAEDYDAMSGIQTEVSTESGENVGYIHNGDWLRFDDVNLTSISNMDARISSKFSGGIIEVRTGSLSGTLIGSIEVSNTGGNQNWTTLSTSISNVSGTEDVYLVFTGGNGYLYNVNWVAFNTNAQSSKGSITSKVIDTITMYPNPVTSTTTIQNAANSKIIIYNMNGKEVLAKFISSNNEVLDLSSLSVGIYYAETAGENVKTRFKIVKN